MVGPTIEDEVPTSGIKYAMIHHHKINTLALWLARSSLRPPSQAILVKGPYQLSSSVVLPHGFPLFCRLQRAVVPCHRQVQHHREGSVPTLKLSCTTPWVSTLLPSSTRSGPMSPTSPTSSWRVRTNSQTQLYYPMGFHYSAVFNAQWSHVTDKCNIMSLLDPVQQRVTSCPLWILSNTVSHHVPVGSCPTPMDESCWWLSLSRPVPLLVFHSPPYWGINFPDKLYSKLRLDPGLLLTKLRLGSGHSLIQCPNPSRLAAARWCGSSALTITAEWSPHLDW